MDQAYQFADLPERLRVKIIVDNGCWIWTGAKNGGGYGCVSWEGRVAAAHRVVRHLLAEDVEVFPGCGTRLVLDHLCRVRACVNPAHIEPTTQAENVRRGANGFELTGKCRNGLHDVTGEAAFVTRRDGRRRCRECIRAHQRECKRAWRARRKAEAVVS